MQKEKNMFYYALIDANNICTAVYAMPAAISGSSYVEITAEQYTSQSVIGMKYANGTWVEVTTYYYAILDDKGIVTNVYESETEMPAASNMVEITAEQYNDSTLIGKYYDRENDTFIVPPVSVLAEHSTSEIQYKNEEKTLETKLDEIDEAIEAIDGAIEALEAGSGSGVTVDAYTKAESDAKYATKEALEDKADATHSHNEYAAAEHTHTGYAEAEHTHTGYAATDHAHTGYAAADHAHNGYAASDHTHNNYAATSHSHSQNEITGLSSALAGKADSNHTHSGYATNNHTHFGYASSTHTHSGYASSSHTHDYLPLSGGTVTGETNFSGGLVRVKGVQTLYHSGSQMVLSSENLATKICGSAITSSKTITVASDERLKADVDVLEKQALIDFMKKIELVSYRYKDEPEGTKHIGVIAQQLLEINPNVAQYFVKVDENGYYSVDYTALSLMALLAVQ